MIYHRGERRVRRVLRLFQSLLRFSGASAFSVCSAVKFKGIPISLENSTVPTGNMDAEAGGRRIKAENFIYLFIYNDI